MEKIAILYAVGANICFALASIAFTSFSKRISVVWMNYFKSTVALVFFAGFALLMGRFEIPNNTSAALLLASGIVGLCIGDMFLFKSFTLLGPGRTLILFSFHPIFTGSASYFLFDQSLNVYQLGAILTMIGCLVILGRENMDKNKRWAIAPLLIALTAILLDATGVVLTRVAFEMEPTMDSSMANLLRAVSCTAAFSAWSLYRPVKLKENFLKLTLNNRILIFMGALLGTFLSLMLYLNAVKFGHLATISAIAATAPIWATVFEFIFFKQKPTKHLYLTFGLFVIGMILVYQ